MAMVGKSKFSTTPRILIYGLGYYLAVTEEHSRMVLGIQCLTCDTIRIVHPILIIGLRDGNTFFVYGDGATA